MATHNLNCSEGDCPNPSVHDRLARIETKLDDFLPMVDQYMKRTVVLDNHVQRVNRKLSWFAGAAAAILFVITFLGEKIKAIL